MATKARTKSQTAARWSARQTAGYVLIAVGGFFLLNTLFGYHLIRLWPVIFVLLGLAIIFRSKGRA